MNYSLSPDPLDRELVFDFFWKFSVFECALKRHGFLKSKGEKKAASAQASWELFGQAIENDFIKCGCSGFKEAVEKIKRLSPERQIVRNGELGWEHCEQLEGQSDAAYTLYLLSTARNNLFHGGKYPDGEVFEIARNKEILRAALVILDACYELHPDIKQSIDTSRAA